MPQKGKLHGGPPPETGIHTVPASTNEDQALSRLNKSYRQSKAQQILRLLKDQDALNQLFRNCDLLDDDDDGAKDKDRRQQEDEDDEDAWSLQEEQRSEAGDSDLSENEAERRAARHVALRRHRNSVDPGRCKTSMGFYNQAEVTEIPYDTDSDNVNDSACSTPRGVAAAAAAGATPAADQPSAKQAVYGKASLNKVSHSNNNNSSRVRKHLHPNSGDGGGEVTVRELSVPEERLVHSARSSRPKTSLTSSSSTRSRYYRQQPHPEAQYHVHVHSHPHPHHNQLHALPQPRGIGDTRQAIISRLDPYHPMAVRPFCESRAAQEEADRVAAAGGAQPFSQPLSSPQPTTPKPSIPRHHQTSSPAHYAGHHHAAATAVTLYDMTPPAFSKDIPVHSTASRARAGAGGAGGSHTSHPSRSTSFLEHQRMVPAGGRARLSVDSSPIHLGEVSPQGRVLGEDLGVGGGGGGGSSRRAPARLTRVKRRTVVGEMAARGSPMHVLTAERAAHGHPSMTVMKLPPLDTAAVVGKGPGGTGRDLVCVGKD